MSEIIKIDENYAKWEKTLSVRFRSKQIKSAMSVNKDTLLFYWTLGRDISGMQSADENEDNFFENLSKDLKKALPNRKSLSPDNLRHMKRFYQLYSRIFPQLEEQLGDYGIFPQVAENSEDKKNQLRAESELLCVPWGHHRCIIDKCGDNVDKALFYVHKTVENNWSRSVLMNMLDTNLYERQGESITNFAQSLPAPQGELAGEITKDPYDFDFLGITEAYHEKELKNAFIDNIVNYLMELGNGFAFMGREYRLTIGDTENFLDLLFYNTKLHCHVVVDVEMEKFKPEHIGRLGTYVSAVNHILKGPDDNPTIGLLVCKDKDNVLAQYSLEASNEPIGISEYELSKLYPADFKGTLPSIDDIEHQLK